MRVLPVNTVAVSKLVWVNPVPYANTNGMIWIGVLVNYGNSSKSGMPLKPRPSIPLMFSMFSNENITFCNINKGILLKHQEKEMMQHDVQSNIQIKRG